MSADNILYNELKQIIEKDNESVLSELKEKAFYVEIDKRKEFENQLLKFAQEISDHSKRNVLYEVLVSLKTIWEQYKPEKNLQKKFQDAFKKEAYHEAAGYYNKLVKQGLDFVGEYQIGDGKLIPVTTKDEYLLLYYDKKEIIFYSIQLVQLKKIPIPGSLSIVDVLALSYDPRISFYQSARGYRKNIDCPLWILLERKDGQKTLFSTDINSLFLLKEGHHLPEKDTVELPITLKNACHISYFNNRLLLLCSKVIHYLKDDGEWKKWYSTARVKNEITGFETTKEGFWVGHSNGYLLILKDLQNVAKRENINGFFKTITNICTNERYISVADKNSLRIATHGSKPVSEPIHPPCTIWIVTFLQENILMIQLANGILIAFDINQWKILWQINLGKNHEQILVFQDNVYLKKKSGNTLLFEIPAFIILRRALESKKILVDEQAPLQDPNEPVRSITAFTGRRDILNEIKQKVSDHFLLYGEPRIGKTSLLNVLPDVLSENAKCCIMNIGKLLRIAHSYQEFKTAFIDTCLQQHFIKRSELLIKTGYQALRLLVNKIKKDRNYCVFGLDDFILPEHFDEANNEKFDIFFKSMLFHPNVRFVMMCNPGNKEKIQKYIENFRKDIRQRKLITMTIPLLNVNAVKATIRKKITLKQAVIDEIYSYTGDFPHLIHFFDNWTEGSNQALAGYASYISKTYFNEIFSYFRDLSTDALLLLAICLHEKKIAENITYSFFYERFPFFRTILPLDRLKNVIIEIDGYGKGMSASFKADSFQVSIAGNVFFFPDAALRIPWIKTLMAICEFTYNPTQVNARKILEKFVHITQSGLEFPGYFGKRSDRLKKMFYVDKLTEQGLKAIKLPMSTFIVIPLHPWQQEFHQQAFEDLIVEFQEINRKAGESKIFYVLLFDLHGSKHQEIRESLSVLERISIIDAAMMQEILLADSPKDRTSRYIFDQLSIMERSPYTTAGAVPDDLFFGRQMEIALIRGLPENIGVFGTRTIGKTSLLRKIHTAFKSQRKWKVYDLDCSRIESEEALLKNLAEKMEIPFEEIPDMDKFRQYVTKDAGNENCRYLFLLDEVDRLVKYDMEHDEKIFNTFNRLCNETMKNNETAARFVLFGFQHMFEQMKDPLSRLYNFMVFMPLKPLDKKGALELVTRPIEKIQVRWKSQKDAEYLVEKCSCHPHLLQAACHALLSTLDTKIYNRDMIERSDVNQALASPGFREICMRFYHSEKRRSISHYDILTKKNIWDRLKPKKNTPTLHLNQDGNNGERLKIEEFLGDIHRITIFSAVRLLHEEGKNIFTIRDIQDELKTIGIDASPDQMRKILDRLCLSGNFRLRDESTMFVRDKKIITEKKSTIASGKSDIEIGSPRNYASNEINVLTFTYEFGVKIYPELLVAHFGGLSQCDEERKRLIQKGNWKSWIEN